jgi:hypothetical protein
MAVAISTTKAAHPGTWGGSESLTQSTATAFQALDPHVEVSFLGMGTATGDNNNNLYSLTATGNGDAVDGMTKFITSTATGEAAVYVEQLSGRMSLEASALVNNTSTDIDQTWASATGNWVFSAADDYLVCKFWNGAWRVLGGVGPTMATAT